MDLFKRKGSKSLGSKSSKSHGYNNDSDPSPSTPPPPTKSPKSRKGSILGRTKSSTPPPPEHFDDFGRPVTAHSKPAFSSLAARAPPLSFGNGYGVGDDDEKELLLVYGYMPLATTLELRLDQVDLVVTRCAAEIRERGLDTPLVLSTMSLDISADDTSNLIRSYLPDANEWAYSLHLASPLAVGSFLKIFTPHYRHLLNIRSHSFLDDDDDDGELQRYKTVVGKNWGKFAELGFSDVETGKLEFDLTESERTNIRAQRESLDWGTFASSGFGGRETFAPQDLIFRQNLIAKIQTYPASQSALNQRLREAEKQLPAFPYDTTPHEEGRILVDINFFEAWADVLVSSGWARDELKESSFALIQWKSRVRDGELPRGRPMENDDRTEERWILVEEVVPREYREELRDGKKKPSKRASFLRSVRKKPREPVRLNVSQVNNTPLATIPASPPATVSRRIDDSVFQEKGPEGATKLMSLSSVALDAQTAYAPSFVSTTGAGHGHESIAERPSEESNPPLPQSNMRLGPPIGLGNGVGGTYSSQRADTKTPAQAGAKGFLARMGSRKVSGGKSPYGQGISSAASAVNSNSAGDSHEPVDSRSGSTVNLNDGRTNVPWNHPPTVSTSTSISSIPPSPPPKRTHDEEPNNRQSDYTRSSYISSTEGEDSPYDGIEDGEEVQEGTVLFRGSRLISQEVGRQALLAPPLATIAQGQEGDQEEVLPPPVGMPTSPARQPLPRLLEPVRPARHDSLPPSPKPDADAPIDEGSQRDKFMSGASAYAQQMKASNASRVSSIVGMYEVRDQGVRLTQYGFGDPQQVSSV
ncbi:hypothetical protein P7C70_g5934, partial [Phenoliferia sp. Uapishka_3]